MNKCIKCGSYAFNLYKEGIDQGGLCDVHYWQGRAHRAETLAQPEQDTCKGCNGNGVVGSILDTDTCPFCNGSGIEAQPSVSVEQPPSFWLSTLDVETRTPIVISHADKTQGSIYADTCIYPVYTTPLQRTWVWLTEEEVIDLWPDLIMHRHTYQFWQNLEAKLKEKNGV